MQTAKEIYQAHLDAVSVALWERDFETVCAHMLFPSFMETDDAVITTHTPEEFLPSLQSFRDKIEALGATAYHRLCRDAVFASDDPNRIEGVHETFALSGATPILDTYLNQMTLIQQDGRWLGAGIRSATRNADWAIIRHPNQDTPRAKN